jgi:energy-coupling factor transporter ATP-binding protein EcfA2
MLTVERLSFSYSSAPPLFQGLDAHVEGGEALAVVGRNGAGKSTLLRLLNGLLRPLEGGVRVAGRSTAGLKVNEIAAHVGTLFQTPEQQLFASTVAEEVEFGPRQFRLPQDEVKRRTDEALSRSFLKHLAGRHPLDLDYASRRFVTLASVLALRPQVLLLDEPQRGLDRIWTKRLEEIIAEERAAGRAIVLICHDMDFVDRNAQSVLALGVAAPRQLPVATFFHDDGLVARASVEKPVRRALEERYVSG